MKNKGLFFELLEFLLMTKKWWLAPILIALIILALIIIFGTSSPASPFIYGMM
ncbi:MAG: DUF5989 family protein [Candidatus Woesearchaeota archaeon]